MLDRIAVLAAAPVASFLALLLELLLCLGIGEAEAELDRVVLNYIAVELANNTFRNLTSFKSVWISELNQSLLLGLPGKPDFLADS